MAVASDGRVDNPTSRICDAHQSVPPLGCYAIHYAVPILRYVLQILFYVAPDFDRLLLQFQY